MAMRMPHAPASRMRAMAAGLRQNLYYRTGTDSTANFAHHSTHTAQARVKRARDLRSLTLVKIYMHSTRAYI